MLKVLLIILNMLCFSSYSFAYFTTAETAEILEQGKYKLTLEPQFLLDPSGVNLVFHFDKPINDSTQIRFNLGLGVIDNFAGFHYKWIPYPDYEKQPAIGVRFSTLYAREESVTILSAVVAPLISKQFSIERVKISPYAALPIGVSVFNSTSTQPILLTLGAEIAPHEMPDTQFGIESGFNMKESSAYLSVHLSFTMIDN